MTSAMERDPSAFAGANGAPRQGEQLQAAATGLIDQATRTAEARASTTMTKVGETLDSVASAIRSAGDGIREEQPEFANLVDTAAERVESVGMYMRNHGPRDAIENVQETVRSQPAVVIGGGLIAGLLLGRLLRSGAAAVQESGSQGGYGSRGGYAARDTYGSNSYDSQSTYRSERGSASHGSYRGDPTVGTSVDGGYGTDTSTAAGGHGDVEDILSDGDLRDDSATGDGVRDEAGTAREAL